MLTAQQILSSKKCGDLFSSADKQVVIAEYREIARAYHPDISSDPQANEVMAKVNQLYEEALRLIESGTWEVSNRLIREEMESSWSNIEYLTDEELNEKTDEELEDLMLEREDGYYCVPEECCPICQFIEYSNCDLARFLEREYKVSRDEVFAKVKALNKRRKKLYDSKYVTEVCSRFNLNPAEIVSGLKDRFGTYRHFRDYISSR